MQQSGLNSLAELENFYLAQNAGLSFPAQQTTVLSCPKKMVGRVIGKNGETIKALQQFTGAQIQIDQRCDPTRVSIAGSPKALQVATSMVQDIVAGTFKGFAMLRSFANQAAKAPDPLGFINQPLPVYIEGYGFVPPSQFYDPNESAAPVYQQNLHGFGADPVSVLRAISPSNTSGSGGQIASPQGLQAGAPQGNMGSLSTALAAQAQLMGMRSPSPLPELTPAAPIFNTTSYFKGLQNYQQPQASMALGSAQNRSLFSSEALQHSEALPQFSMQANLPPLSSSLTSTSRSSQSTDVPTSLSVWSQLEKLSPDGAPVSGSPVLTPLRTPSRSSSPLAKEVAAAQNSAAESEALLAQLQALSMLNSRAPASQPLPAAPTSEALPSLPLGWIQLKDPEERSFYYNTMTKQSQYLPPASSAEAAANRPQSQFAGLGGQLPQHLFY